MELSKEEILLRRIEDLEKKVEELQGEIRFLKSTQSQIPHNKEYNHSFWHESQNPPPNTSNTNKIYMDMNNLQHE